MRRFFVSVTTLLCPILACAQLAVTVSPIKVSGQKAIVPLALKNSLADKVESARAVVFLSDAQGKVVGQATKWIIGGSTDKPGLAPGATNAFFFVMPTENLKTTNLTAKVMINRLVLEGGKLVDPAKNVQITQP